MSGYYFLWIFLSVIWSTNTISVSVIVLQMRDTMLVIIELIFHLPFTGNLIPRVNNKSLYLKVIYYVQIQQVQTNDIHI